MITIIGGSGFYNFLDNYNSQSVSTPFGDVQADVGMKEGQEVSFIPRHGKLHSVAPQSINYRANIYAALMLKADIILATNAVGSLNQSIGPGSLALPDNILDFTHGRDSSFFQGSDLEITTRSGNRLSGVVHTDVSHPFDQDLQNKIKDIAASRSLSIHQGGTLAVFNGPRYETAAEIRAVKILGADFVGMTSAPEVFLAKELDIPYATMAVITNYAAGMQASVSHQEVEEVFGQRIAVVKSLFSDIISSHS